MKAIKMSNPNPKTYVVKHPNGEYINAWSHHKYMTTTPIKQYARRYFKKRAKEIANKFIGGSIEKI